METFYKKLLTASSGLLLLSAYALSQTQSPQVLNVTSILTEPYLREGDNGEFLGYIPDLLEEFERQLNVKFRIIPVPDKSYGMKNETSGEWNGMVGEVLAGRADMIAAPLTVTHNRAKILDFTQPFQSVGPVIVMKRPEEEKAPVQERLSRLLAPFSASVWLMLILAFIVTGTVLYIISYFNPYEWRRMAKDGEATLREQESFTCLNAFWFTISTLALQGFTRTPRSMGGRIATTFWWMFILITISTYIASLTNMLRLGPQPNEAHEYSKIDSLKELVDHPNVKIAVVKGGATEQFFRESTGITESRVIKQIYRYSSEMPSGASELIEKLRKNRLSDLAIIMESAMAKVYIQTPPCTLYMISNTLITRHYSFAFDSSKPNMANEFNLVLLSLQYSGTLASLERKWFTGTCKHYIYEYQDEVYDFSGFHPIDLGTFSGALLILTCGLIFGGLITTVEICIFRFAEAHPEEDEKTDQNSSKVASKTTADTPVSQALLEPEVTTVSEKGKESTTV